MDNRLVNPRLDTAGPVQYYDGGFLTIHYLKACLKKLEVPETKSDLTLVDDPDKTNEEGNTGGAGGGGGLIDSNSANNIVPFARKAVADDTCDFK